MNILLISYTCSKNVSGLPGLNISLQVILVYVEENKLLWIVLCNLPR